MSKGSRIFQFSCRVPNDLRDLLGNDHWRESLRPDIEVEAITAYCRKAAETDTIIQRSRSGTLRIMSDAEIDDLAIHWSSGFQISYEGQIAYEI